MKHFRRWLVFLARKTFSVEMFSFLFLTNQTFIDKIFPL